MWGEETGAETMTLNPWAGVNQQPQVWQNMNNRGNGNPTGNAPVGTFAPNGGAVRPGSQQWDGAANPAGRPAWNPHAPRWTPTVNHNNPTGWPVQQQHWNVPNSNGTYAEQTKKNMALNRNSGPNPSMPQRFDGHNWGSKVDQQTPWDTGNNGGAPPQMHDNKDWGGGARWSQPPGGWQAQMMPQMVDWQQGQPRHHDHWAAHAAAGMVPAPGGAWPPQQPIGVPSGSEQQGGRVPYDPNPQTPGPWVAPQPTEMNNDMMWHDPNPKQKKIQKDVGTAIWGDPTSQQEIKRWKESESDGEYTGGNGSDWGTGSNSSTQPTGWGDVGPGPQCVSDGTERWAVQPQPMQSGWSEKLCSAAEKGLIPFVPASQVVTQSFMMQVDRLLALKTKLDSLENASVAKEGQLQKAEQERVACEMNTTKSEMAQIQKGIQSAMANGALCADGQSRLQQWKKSKAAAVAGGSGSPDEKMLAGSSSDSNVPSLVAGAKNMNIHGDWTPVSSVADNDGTKSEDQVSSTGTNNEKEPSVKGSASPTPPPTQIDDGPQEFVPGKKWEWRDPNKVAEDPNATPGNCKPNPLLSSGNNFNFAFSNSAVNTVNPYGPEVPVGNPQNYWQNNPQGFPNQYGREMWNGRGRASNGAQFMPQHRMMQQGNGSGYNNRAPPQFMPGKGVWILLSHQGTASDTQLNFSCTRAGQLVNVVNAGNNTVLLRYADTNGESVAQKLNVDFSGIDRVKILSDEEVEKIVKNRSSAMQGNGWTPNCDAQWSNGGSPAASAEMINSQNVFSNQDDLNRPQY